MQSVVVTRTGGPEVLELPELPDPEPGAGEVVVEVEAAGVNFIDVYQREGRYPLEPPFTAGSEAAGVVRAVGDGVTDVIQEVTTTAVDLDGDGVPDIVDTTVVTAVDVDGDGTFDVVEEVSATGIDGDGDSTIDEVDVTDAVYQREDIPEA